MQGLPQFSRYSPIPPPDRRSPRVVKLHVLALFVHALCVAVLIGVRVSYGVFTLPLFSDDATATARTEVVLSSQYVSQLDVTVLVIVFEALTMLAHGVYATVGHSRWRWFEYMLSAPIMYVCVAASVYVLQVEWLVTGALMIHIVMWFGVVLQSQLDKQRVWVMLGLAHALCALAFVPVQLRMIRLALDPPAGMPLAVLAIPPLELALFMSFGIAETCFVLRSRTIWVDELVYTTLSLTSKLVLAVLVYVSFVQ